MCTRSMNLGCFCVVFFDVLMFSPFVPKTVAHGSFSLACGEGCFSLTQSACQGRCSGCRKKSVGRKSPAGLHRRVDAQDSRGLDSEYRRA